MLTGELKTENQKQIYWILAFPLILCAAIQAGVTSISDEWLKLAAIEGASGALLYGAALVLTNLLPQSLKHKLVFTRLKDEMPAGRIHRLISKDPRIDFDAASTRWPDIFDESIGQSKRNSLWYSNIYKPVRDSSPVKQAHRTFLLFRDVTSGLAFLFFTAAIWFALGQTSWIPPLHGATPVVLFVFTVLTLIVARNAGTRMVVNAVAEAL